MLYQRSALNLARRVAVRAPTKRSFVASTVRSEAKITPPTIPEGSKKFEEVQAESDLLPPGAPEGTIPTDANQSTGLERLEILGKMQGVDIFDMKPLDASRRSTMEDPIMVRSAGDEQYCGCTGYPADSHVVQWITISRKRPIGRCYECGQVYKMEYVGPADDGHGHDDHHGDHHVYEEPKTIADYVKPEYFYK